MSDPLHPPAGGDRAAFDAIRREAKQLLRQARAGDAPVLAALKALLPRLATLSDAEARETVRLADVQHAIARRLGHAHWAAL